MKPLSWCIAILVTAVFTLSGAATSSADASVPLISKDDLRALLNTPDITILDVRIKNDWESSKFKIPGAIHADPRSYSTWGERYPRDKPLILYCA